MKSLSNTPISVAFSTKEPSHNQLDELWNKIDKYERRNLKAEQKIDCLFVEYEKSVFPHEKTLGHTQCAWVKQLLTFLARKELNIETRKQLMRIIEDELNELQEYYSFYNLSEFEGLCDEYAIYYDKMFKKEKQRELDRACQEFENLMKVSFGHDVNLPHKLIRETLKSGGTFEIESLIASIHDAFLAQNPDILAEQEDPDWQDFSFDYSESEDEEALKIKEIFKGTQLNKMYKRVANVIHPDKERDPLKKAEKHHLMQTLAKAKRENDVITLIRLFSTYVPDAQYVLDENTQQQITHLFEMKIRELNRDHRDLFHHQGIKSHIWKQFSATSQKKTQQKIQTHIAEIERITVLLNKRIEKMTTLKQMNHYLKTLDNYLYSPGWSHF